MNSNIGVIVQARMSSSRFPGKSLHHIGGIPLVERVVERMLPLGLPLVVAISSNQTDDILCEYLRNKKINYYRGDLLNVRKRFIQVAQVFGFERIIRINGDSPFINLAYLEENFEFFNNFKYVDGIHDKGLLYGTGFEIVDLDLLEAIPDGNSEYDEHVTIFLRNNMRDNYLSIIPPKRLSYRDDLFLAIDYLQDAQFCNEILKKIKKDQPAVNEILELLMENDELLKMRCCEPR